VKGRGEIEGEEKMKKSTPETAVHTRSMIGGIN
jgi:hypothetical protein